MCRNIQPLFHFEPPASEADVRAAALQYVRKVSGFQNPSKINEAAFEAAVEAISAATSALLDGLQSDAAPKNRAIEIARAKARSAKRFSTP